MLIEKGLPKNSLAWPPGVLDALKPWELGDVVRGPPLFYFADARVPIWGATHDYTAGCEGPEIVELSDPAPFGLVTTPTCDIAEEDREKPARPWVQISPIFVVDDRGWLKKLRRGLSWPQYMVHIPDLYTEDQIDAVWAADLRIEMAVEKGWLAQQERILGFADEMAKRSVGGRIAKLRGRPAFSKELVRDLISNLHSALAAAFDEDGELDGRSSDVKEVCIRVDSFLSPHTAFLTVMTDAEPREDVTDWFDRWADSARPALADQEISLQAFEYRAIDDVSVREYQDMTSIWRAS